MIMCDSKGAIYEGRQHGMNDTKSYVANWTNKDKIDGSLEEVIKDADVFIGVSVADLLTKDMVKSMADDPIIFAMANLTLKSNLIMLKKQVLKSLVQDVQIFLTRLIMS